jgi:hypothetical protein
MRVPHLFVADLPRQSGDQRSGCHSISRVRQASTASTKPNWK